MESLGIHRLNTDFQLCQSRAETVQERNLFFLQNICGNFKMEICDAIVMFLNILPYCHCMGMATVKSPVYKFYLFYLMIQEKLQFLFYDINVTQPYALIHGGQAVAAAKRAAPAGLVI